jgi:hypothetical protein
LSYLSGGRSAQLAIRVISSSRGASLLIRNIIDSGLPMLGAAVTYIRAVDATPSTSAQAIGRKVWGGATYLRPGGARRHYSDLQKH